MKPSRPHLDHQPPHWIDDAATYFITICTEPRNQNQLCHPELRKTLFETIQFRNEKRIWYCHLAVFMPDHVHFLLSFPDIPSFAPLLGDWKRWLSRQHAIIWQDNFFDHRLRDEENFGQKADYILHNPVRATFVQNAQDWPYTWMPETPPK